MTSRSLFIAAVFLVVSFMAFGLSYLVLNSTKLAITAFSGIVALVIFFIEPFVGLINYFLFLYVRPHEYVDALIGMPVMLMIGAATAALMLLHMIVNKRPGLYSRAPQNWLVVWFLLSIILSHLSFFYVEGAVESVRGFMPIVIMYLLIANGVTTEKKFKFTIQFIAVLTLILAISGIVQHFTGFGLGGAEMYRGRIQGINGKISIVSTAPSPVKVKIVGGIVSVAHKSMATAGPESRIFNGSSGIQLRFQQRGPACSRIIIPDHTLHVITVFEVILQGIFHTVFHRASVTDHIGPTSSLGRDTVTHFDAYSTMIHQGGHGLVC